MACSYASLGRAGLTAVVDARNVSSRSQSFRRRLSHLSTLAIRSDSSQTQDSRILSAPRALCRAFLDRSLRDQTQPARTQNISETVWGNGGRLRERRCRVLDEPRTRMISIGCPDHPAGSTAPRYRDGRPCSAVGTTRFFRSGIVSRGPRLPGYQHKMLQDCGEEVTDAYPRPPQIAGPGALPVGALPEAGFLVAKDWEERHGHLGHHLLDQLGEV